MQTFDNCALFIGVNDYTTFDESIGAPRGSSSLAGSRNDVISFYRVCRQMGIAPENIRVLTSPKLTTADIRGIDEASIREATESEILEGIDWLAQRMGGKNGFPGLFTYSGHGDWKEGVGLVICPSDTSGLNLDHSIALAKIQATFAKYAALESLTMVLDCCHSGVARGLRRALSLTGRPISQTMEAGLALMGERVLSAAAPKDLSYQSCFAGEHHGAFSWALTSTMSQWTAQAQDSSVELSVTYGELLDRAQRLLATLDFKQVPELKGPPLVAQMPFFHCGRGGRRDDTSSNPDKQRRGGQLTPDMRYAVEISNVTDVIWNIYVSGNVPPTGASMNTEYWQLGEAFIQAVRAAEVGTTFTFTPSALSEMPTRPPPVQMPAQSLWTLLDGPPSDNLFLGPIGNQQVVGLVSNLAQGTPWGGSLTWIVGTNGAIPSADIISGQSATTLTYGPAIDYACTAWYAMNLPPLSWSTNNPLGTIGILGAGIAVTQMGTELCLGFANPPYTLIVAPSSNGGTTWGNQFGVYLYGNPTLNPSGNAPALAYLNGSLVLAFTTNSDEVNVCSTTALGSAWQWLSTNTTQNKTTTAPALGLALDSSSTSRLCLAYDDGISMKVLVWNGTSWSAENGPGTTANGAPALAGFTPALPNATPGLYLAQIGSTRKTVAIFRALSMSTNGTSWSSTPLAVIQIDMTAGTASSAPGATPPQSSLEFTSISLAAFNGALYLSFTDSSGNVGICSSADGVSFSGFAEIGRQVAGVETNTNAPMAAFGSNPSKLAIMTTKVLSGAEKIASCVMAT